MKIRLGETKLGDKSLKMSYQNHKAHVLNYKHTHNQVNLVGSTNMQSKAQRDQVNLVGSTNMQSKAQRRQGIVSSKVHFPT
jgi:hypothetical protein